MKVFVYKNLHRGLWSVRALQGPLRGLVIAHCWEVTLSNCVFRVSESGRQRVLRDKRKNVHAGIVGELDNGSFAPTDTTREVTYNPYLAPYFFDVSTKTAVLVSTRVCLRDKVYVDN